MNTLIAYNSRAYFTSLKMAEIVIRAMASPCSVVYVTIGGGVVVWYDRADK